MNERIYEIVKTAILCDICSKRRDSCGMKITVRRASIYKFLAGANCLVMRHDIPKGIIWIWHTFDHPFCNSSYFSRWRWRLWWLFMQIISCYIGDCRIINGEMISSNVKTECVCLFLLKTFDYTLNYVITIVISWNYEHSIIIIVVAVKLN